LCGLEGCAEDASEGVKQLILDTLEKVAAEGVDQDKVEAALHALELHQREINGDSYPYGLQLILTALSTATHRGDPIELLDIDPVLDKLKQDIKDPDYIPRLIREELLSNPHRLLLTVKPDTSLSARQAAAEAERLQQIQENLDEADKQEIIAQSQALQQRQAQEDDLSILPKVELSDVPNDVHWPTGKPGNLHLASGDLPYHFYDRGTNGIAYQHLILPLPAIPDSLQALLPLYSSCLTELGAGEHSYLDMQARQSRV